MRRLQDASISTANLVALIDKGGTNADNPIEAAINLRLVTHSMKDKANGVAGLDEDGKISPDLLPSTIIAAGSVNITGSLSNYTDQVSNYIITDYDAFLSYTLSAVRGSVSRSGNTITYTAPGTAGDGGFIVNGRTFPVTIMAIVPLKPSITIPTNASTNVDANVAVTGSAFTMNTGPDTHASSDWQIASDSAFTNIVTQSIADTVNKTTWTSGTLVNNTTYYLRVRYTSSAHGSSEWSDTISFTTKLTFIKSNEEAKLVASDKADTDNLGWSVKISKDGTRAIVGARLADVGGKGSSGAAYVFVRSGSSWSQEAKLSPADRQNSDVFGFAVGCDIDATRAVISAYIADPGSISNAGKIYIWLRTGTTWALEATLNASDPEVNANFGYSVSMTNDGSRVLATSPTKDNGAAADQGAAYVFSRSGTSWAQEQKIMSSDGIAGDQFGISGSISGDGTRLIVGAHGADSGAITSCGAAYIFSRSGTSWTQETKLMASDKSNSAQFGTSVSINDDGSMAAAGAPLATYNSVAQAGKAYIFTRSGVTWTQEVILTASDHATNGKDFGFKVALAGSTSEIVVGAYLTKANNLVDAGAAYIFKKVSGVWNEINKLIASDAVATDQYGISVSITADGSRVIIGSWQADVGGITDAGAAYVYS